MHTIRNTALLLAVALAALTAGTTTASAVTVTPTGYYISLGTFALTVGSTSQTFACRGFRIDQTVAGSGVGNVASSTIVSSGCSNPVIPTVSFSNTAAWQSAITLTGTRIEETFTIPTDGLTLQFSTCIARFGGTITRSTWISSLTSAVPTWSFTSSTLTVTSNNRAMACIVTPVGLAATVSGAFELDRTMFVSG